VTLRLQDSLTGEQRDFVPVTPGKVGIYICGLTTQAPPHLGHVRFAVAFDVLRRWLTRGHGYDVTLIRNVTDIDDKILAKSAESGEPWYAVSYRNEGETAKALADLGVLPPTYEPRATGHIPEMVALMGTIIEKGHAYPAADGSGDVYFDVRSWPTYGALTKQKIDDMAAAEDADPRGKHDPRDFALWKGHKADEPATASWPTPFGDGRPGWHLECSAMARKYLGDTFDIHGGGVDLRFPHHENELAQSTSAGIGFANYWLHNGWVTMGGEKMSKSLGNSLRVSTVLAEHRPVVVRYYLTAAHYRSMIEYQETSLAEAAAAVERIEGFLHRALPDLTTSAPDGGGGTARGLHRVPRRRPRRLRRPRRHPRDRPRRQHRARRGRHRGCRGAGSRRRRHDRRARDQPARSRVGCCRPRQRRRDDRARCAGPGAHPRAHQGARCPRLRDRGRHPRRTDRGGNCRGGHGRWCPLVPEPKE
jgi:cysteinyl-tRNA synthetase